MMTKKDAVPDYDEIYQIRVSYLTPRPEIVTLFTPGLVSMAISKAGGADVFVENRSGQLPPLLKIARSYIEAGKRPTSTQIDIRRMKGKRLSPEELYECINKGQIHHEAIFKLKQYRQQRMRRERLRRRQALIREADDIRRKIRVPKMSNKEAISLEKLPICIKDEDKAPSKSKFALAVKNIMGQISTKTQMPEVSGVLATGFSAAAVFCLRIFCEK